MLEQDLPISLDLFNFTNGTPFDNWDKGIEANNRYKTSMSIIRVLRILRPIAMFIVLMWGFNIIQTSASGYLVILSTFLFMKKSLAGILLDNATDSAKNNLAAAQGEHAAMLANAAGPELMISSWSTFRYAREVLIYSQDRFAYLDAERNILIAYNNSNIKEVSRVRLHTGSHTDSNSDTYGGAAAIGNSGIAVGGAKTSTVADTTDYYEWHFDILTDFINCPKISFVVPDSPNVENAIGEAYAILKR